MPDNPPSATSLASNPWQETWPCPPTGRVSALALEPDSSSRDQESLVAPASIVADGLGHRFWRLLRHRHARDRRGRQLRAQEQIKSLGSQNILLRSVKPPQDQKASQRSGQFLLVYGLTYADVRAIQATIPGVMVVVPGRIIPDFVWNINHRVDSEIVGTVPGTRRCAIIRSHRVGFSPMWKWREKRASACSAPKRPKNSFPWTRPPDALSVSAATTTLSSA